MKLTFKMFQTCTAQYFNIQIKKANALGDTITVLKTETTKTFLILRTKEKKGNFGGPLFLSFL